MERFLTELREDLDALAARSLRRHLRMVRGNGRRLEVDGRSLINLASNDYLALADHRRLKAAAIEATQQLGTGAGASRLVAGHLDLHARVEQAITTLKHPGTTGYGSLLLPTGYMANLAVLTTLAGPGDLICLDKLCHASLIDAAQAGGAEVRVFPHLRYGKLDRLLSRIGPAEQSIRNRTGSGRPPGKFIVTDSVFSMDGDVADLPTLCDLAQRHQAIVIVDEAHATGVLGESGAGLCELQSVGDRVDVVISTASKALGGLGGIITARDEVIDTLINGARPFIYTTGVPPAQAAAISAAVDVVREEPWRRQRVLAMATQVRQWLSSRGWMLPPSPVVTPIIPLIVGGADEALALQNHLIDQGLLGIAIRPPTVAPGSARVRLSLRADLEDADVDHLLRVLSDQRIVSVGC